MYGAFADCVPASSDSIWLHKLLNHLNRYRHYIKCNELMVVKMGQSSCGENSLVSGFVGRIYGCADDFWAAHRANIPDLSCSLGGSEFRTKNNVP